MTGILLEGEGLLAKLVNMVPTIISLGNQCFTAVTENELLLAVLAVGFVGVGFRVVNMMIGAAKHSRG